MTTILLKNGTILTMDSKRRIIQDGSVVIEGNRVVEVGKSEKIDYKAEHVIDCKGKLILPGLIDSHLHLAQALLRGSADDLALIPWLSRRVWPLQSSYDHELGKLSAQLCCIELIKSGTTTFIEAMLNTKYGFDGIAEAVKNIGLRGVLSKIVMDRPYYADKKVYEGMVESKEESMKEAIAMIEKWHHKANDRIHVWFGPRTPGACSPSFYQEISEKAKKYKVGVTLHLAETKEDVDYLKREFGMTPMQFMKRCELLGKHVVYAHGVWMTDEDFPILKESGSTVCHCPSCNLKLASGFAPILKMLAHGINVSLGCDGAPCNNTYDLIREMRLAALIHKGRLLDSQVLPAERVLELATLNGARATQWNGKLGSIEPNKLADIIVVDMIKPHLLPIRNPVSTLVYSANGSDVEAVIVDGKLVMENRELKTVDEAKILDKVQAKGLLLDERAGLKIGPNWPSC
ncbi:MAG TPA: amidohydrolase [Thermoplasmata archaeon]|nr:amidohydrolase [Thermoplasmata archaeon]